MKNHKRLRLFDWILKKVKHPDGMVLPFWLRCLHCLLFPIQFFYYTVGNKHGYQLMTDTWIIHGKSYSDALFRHFTIGGDETFKIVKRDNDTITIQRVNI